MVGVEAEGQVVGVGVGVEAEGQGVGVELQEVVTLAKEEMMVAHPWVWARRR